MITGLNTSIEFKGQKFHVQTEDRGRNNPILESIIYQGGAIVGAKKSSYKEFLESGSFSEKTLRQMLEVQHYSIVRAIRSGRIAERRRKRQQAQASEKRKSAPPSPHVELISNIIDEGHAEAVREMRIRVVETLHAKAVANTKVSVEIFGSGLPTQRLKGTTDPEGYLNLKVKVPQSHRVAAAMLFSVDKPEPSQELKVLLVKA